MFLLLLLLLILLLCLHDSFISALAFLLGARGSVVVKALAASRKVAGSSLDEVDFLN
jgi:hypothetical protein